MTAKEKRDKAVDDFAIAMKARLDWAAEVKGRKGWDRAYPERHLLDEIQDDCFDLRDDDGCIALDIANRCMMLWWRRENGIE